MSYCLAEIILAAGHSDEESAFWMQMLALVILAGLVGVGSLIRMRASKFKGQQQEYAGSGYTPPRWKATPFNVLKSKAVDILSRATKRNIVLEEPAIALGAASLSDREKRGDESPEARDLASGMELLELDFLVGTVENTKGGSKNDVTMKKFAFNELVRRQRLDAVDSTVLRIYAMDARNLYGKDIQCEAMKQLAQRTGLRP